MTPKDVLTFSETAIARFGLDPIAGDPDAEALLHHCPEEAGAVLANIDGMKRVRTAHPRFFETYDYDWVFDPSVYRRAMEANLQARALQLLAALHANPYTPAEFDFADVIVRMTFQTSADPCTPFHLPYQGRHLIVSPFSFQEFVLLFVRAWIDSTGGGAGGWEAFSRFDTFEEEVSPFLRQALLRALTSDAFHPGFPGETPMDRVKRHSAWFSDAAENGDIDAGIEVPLTVSLIDFALAHEIGHALHRHDGLKGEADLRLQREQDADVTGFALYSSSWGWRDELLDSCPLNQGPRILLGPLLFHLFIKWQVALRQGLALRALTSGHAPDAESIAQLRREAGDSQARTDLTFRQIGAYEAQIKQNGAVFGESDVALFSGIARAGAAFTLHVFRAVQSIPEEDYHLARRMGAVGF